MYSSTAGRGSWSAPSGSHTRAASRQPSDIGIHTCGSERTLFTARCTMCLYSSHGSACRPRAGSTGAAGGRLPGGAMARRSPMIYASGVTVRKNVRIPMRDGTLLAADLYMPEDAREPLPVVMEYIPYRKDEVPPGLRFYSYLPQNGYIVARVDIRGTGSSEGVVTDEYVPVEQQDGYDAVEWLAEQPFCDGNVNMMGISYGGFTSLQVATHQPPHLRTIVPMYFTDDRYTDDCHYRGGHLRQYYDVSHYGNFMIAYNALPPYPEWSEDWAGVWSEHLERNEPYLLKWLDNQTDG